MAARPDLPTLREEGVSEYDLTGWWAAYFPAKTPPAVVSAMRDLIHKAAKTPHVTETFATFALEPLLTSSEEMAALQRAEQEKWGKLVRSANLRLD